MPNNWMEVGTALRLLVGHTVHVRIEDAGRKESIMFPNQRSIWYPFFGYSHQQWSDARNRWVHLFWSRVA